MPEPQTPGQVAFAAYRQVDPVQFWDEWAHLLPEQQRAWEAAAQAVRADLLPTPERPAVTTAVAAGHAVLADGRCHARELVQHWHTWHRDAHAPALPLLTAMHALEAWLAQQEDDTHA